MGKHDIIDKTRSTLHIALSLEKDRAIATVNTQMENLVKFGYAVFEICKQTDKHTDTYRHADCNT